MYKYLLYAQVGMVARREDCFFRFANLVISKNKTGINLYTEEGIS